MCALRLSHAHRPTKSRKVARSRGLEEYHGLLLFAASNVLPLRGDINPMVSIEMRRMSNCSNAARGEERDT